MPRPFAPGRSCGRPSAAASIAWKHGKGRAPCERRHRPSTSLLTNRPALRAMCTSSWQAAPQEGGRRWRRDRRCRHLRLFRARKTVFFATALSTSARSSFDRSSRVPAVAASDREPTVPSGAATKRINSSGDPLFACYDAHAAVRRRHPPDHRLQAARPASGGRHASCSASSSVAFGLEWRDRLR